MLTLLSASPSPIRNFFVWTPIASYGAIRQKDSWTLMVFYGAERVNKSALSMYMLEVIKEQQQMKSEALQSDSKNIKDNNIKIL